MKRLDERHFKVMEMLMKKHTQQEIADELGVSRMTIHRWLKDPEFEAEYKHVLRNHSKNKLGDVLDAMVEAAIVEKSAAAAKLILEVNSMLKPDDKQQVTVNNQIDIAKIKEELKNL